MISHHSLSVPHYFRQTKYKSFQRQLNLWGFERVSKGLEKGCYFHPCFLKDDKAKCGNMVHTSIKGTSVRRPILASHSDLEPFSTPENFIASIGDHLLRSDVEALHKMILRLAPDLLPHDRVKGTLGYGKYSHRYKTGRHGVWCKIGISCGKQIVLHCSGLVGEKHVISRFAHRFPKAKAGISCLRFNRLSDLDPTALEELIRTTADADEPIGDAVARGSQGHDSNER